VAKGIHHGAGVIFVRYASLFMFYPPLISFSNSAFTDMYSKDKTRFGDPARSTFKVSEVRELDSWQTVLQAHARSVEPLNPKKRKRPVD
jgi:hypothetical protein